MKFKNLEPLKRYEVLLRRHDYADGRAVITAFNLDAAAREADLTAHRMKCEFTRAESYEYEIMGVRELGRACGECGKACPDDQELCESCGVELDSPLQRMNRDDRMAVEHLLETLINDASVCPIKKMCGEASELPRNERVAMLNEVLGILRGEEAPEESRQAG